MSQSPRAVLVLAASMGGPEALRDLCARLRLPADCAVLILQHIQEDFSASLVRSLADAGAPRARLATDGDRVETGDWLVAPGGSDLAVGPGGALSLQPPPSGRPAPSFDLALEGAARAFGRRLVAVLLSGMDVQDGQAGVRAAKASGGRTLAQDERSAKSFGMARDAVREGLIDVVAPLAILPEKIERALAAIAERPEGTT
ncbi:MAG: chemotaxis protein CheB [Planctomycetes bacterium]|nr:chemotaxis protein CheB [Planctomycetota bacterium]